MVGVSHLLLTFSVIGYLVVKGQLPSALVQLKLYWRQLTGIFIAGGLGITCFTYALIYGDVIRVMVLFYLLPIWGVLGGYVFLDEQVDAQRKIGVVLAILGAFLVLGHIGIFSEPPSMMDLMGLLSGFLFAANNIIFRAAQKVDLSIKLSSMFAGAALLSFGAIFIGLEGLPASLSTSAITWLLIYTFTWLLLANIGSQWAVTQMEAGRSSILIIVELFVAVVSSLVVLGDTLTMIEWLGVVLIVLAAFLEAVRVSPDQYLPKQKSR